MFRRRVGPHSQARREAHQQPVEQAQQPLAKNHMALHSWYNVSHRDASYHRHQSLPARVARLPRHHRQEHRQEQQVIQVWIEHAHDGRRHESDPQIDLQPGVTQPQTAQHRRAQALPPFHAHHRAHLRADFVRARLEQVLPPHQAHQPPLVIAHRVHRKMPVHRSLHRLQQIAIGPQGEHVRPHHFAQLFVRIAQHQIAHHQHPQQTVVAIRHIAVGNERLFGQVPQRLNRLAHRHLRTKHRHRRLHQPAHAIARVLLVVHPLVRLFNRRRRQHRAAFFVRELQQHLLRRHWIHRQQSLRHRLIRALRQQRRRLVRSAACKVFRKSSVRIWHTPENVKAFPRATSEKTGRMTNQEHGAGDAIMENRVRHPCFGEKTPILPKRTEQNRRLPPRTGVSIQKHTADSITTRNPFHRFHVTSIAIREDSTALGRCKGGGGDSAGALCGGKVPGRFANFQSVSRVAKRPGCEAAIANAVAEMPGPPGIGDTARARLKRA